MKDTRIKVSTLIENQVPKYLRESSPLLVDFLRQYYISIESKGQVLDILENIDHYININTLTSFSNKTKLINNVSVFDTDIQVESTLGFPDTYGLIKINNEIISYESKTENLFINCFRGFSGIESYGNSNFEKNAIFNKTEISEHSLNDDVENLSVLFLSEFLTKIKKQILPGFENRNLNPNVDENIFIKQSKDFYSSKGTTSSFDILFKSLYGENVSVIYPSKFLIEPSKSNYLVTKDIVVEPIQGNIEDLINQTITQNEDEYFSSASSTVTRVERILRNNIEYYVLSLDFGYDRDIETRGSFIGDFEIHPKTKIIGSVAPGQNFIDVDSTAGFPNSGELVVNKSGINFIINYKSKSLNQFFECENVPDIEDGLDIRLNSYAFGISPFNGEEIRFRIGGVLSDLNILDDTVLSDVGDTIRIISPGKISNDIRTKNWFYNISVTYGAIPNFSFDDQTGAASHITRQIETIDEHNLLINDELTIIISNGLTFNTKVSDVQNKNKIVVENPLPPFNPQEPDAPRYISKSFTYKIKRKILKSKFKNYPELLNLNTNIQNVYKNIESDSVYITSPSIPNYLGEELSVSDRSILINGKQLNDRITFAITHSFLTGDVVNYSYGNKEQNLNINEGLYYVKKINDKTIRLYKSREDILLDKFLTFSDEINVIDNKITPYILSNKKLDTQKLVRKLNKPKFSPELSETKYGSTGILLNGVEISNYKSNDFIYYGPIEDVKVISDLSNYDVINPNVIQITDPKGVGIGASVILHINGNLKKVNILNSGFDYLTTPKINIIGGNGDGYKLDLNLIDFTHSLDFNSENANSLNLSNNSIIFFEEHKFRNIEKIVYKTNGKLSIGGLVDLSNYYIKSVNSTTIQLYPTEQDALSGINTINMLSLGQGIHTIESTTKKKKISSINVLESGSNYSNKKIIISSENVNDKKNTIFAKKHGYKDKDIIYYKSIGQKIEGLNEGNYYVKFINENEFSLIEIIQDEGINPDFNFINNTIVNFKNKGLGNHIFNYPEIQFFVEGITGVNAFSSNNSHAKIQPIFRGKIENIFIASAGSKYGSPDIINFERQPIFNLIEGSGALLKPIILNGRIEKVLVLNGGINYNTPPEIKVIGDGNGAILTPIIENGILKDVIVINKGKQYKENSTNILVKTNNLNINTKLKFKIKSWNINQYAKLNEFNALSQTQSLLTESLNQDYGLQYKHIALPDDLRKIIFTSKIVEDQEYFISDKKNDNEKDSNLLVHSPIIGWAYDGNPIYGPYGFDTPQGGRIRKMESSYSLTTENLQDRPKYLSEFLVEENYPSGFFVEDYNFNNSGDLDVHNGRFCITPEFPNGIYAYFCTLDEQFNPKFPYIIGNYYKSVPIEFNLDKNSNQDIFDINNENLVRITNPYKFLSKTSNYDYLTDSNSIKNQTSKISSVSSGSVDFIDIVSPGDNYKIDENIVIETLEKDTGFGALVKISRILGKLSDKIDTEIKDVNNVQFSNSNVFNNTIGISQFPHNLNNGDFIIIEKINIDDIFLEEKFYKINIIPTTLILSENVGDELETNSIDYFSVSGNLNYPFVIEDDIFTIGEEELKILSVDTDSGRIKVLRGYNSTPVSEHFKNDILKENPRKFYFDKILDKNFTINKTYYFNPEETLGIGTTSGVGIGITLFFSNPGVGITQTFVPTRTLYLKNHNLKTGDKLIYNTNGGVGIKVSNDGLDEFTLTNNDLLYVAKISDNLIGLSTNRVTLSPEGDFVGIETTASILYFKDFGIGLNHSFTTDYNENLTRNVNNIKTKLTTRSEHFLQLGDVIDLDVKSLQTKTFNLFYDSNSKNLILDKKIIEAIDSDIFTISNHNFSKGEKVLFNSQSNALDGKKYYVLPLNSNQFKLSLTYFGAFNNEDIVTINSNDDIFLSLVNPPINIFKNSTIVFDLSDESLEGFDFNLFEDDNYNNIFYGFDNFDVNKNGIPGTPNAKLTLNIKETKISELYYSLIIKDKNNISREKLEYFNDDLNVLHNNTLIIKNSLYSGEKIVSGIGTNFFQFNLTKIPESLSYVNNDNSIIKYTTKSKNALGPISEVRIISKGKNYKKLPIIKKIDTKFGAGAFLKIGTNSIGKIQKVIIEDIGFDYFSDNSLRPFSKIPEILKINPLSSLDEIKVLFFGEQYNVAPNLILIDGVTKKVVNDIILDFNLNSNFVTIVKNTNGINDVTPIIIPINNTNGTNISFIEPNTENNTLKVFLNQEYSNIYEFPFSKVVATTLNDVEIFTNQIIVDDSSKIPEFSIIKIFNQNESSIENEILYVKEKNGKILTVERGYLDTEIPDSSFKYNSGSLILLLEKNVLIENVNILNATGKQYNSENYDYKLYPLIQITPQLGGQGSFVTLDSSQILNPGDFFGTYDVNNSFGIITPEGYFPRFEISLKKNIFSVGETIISGNKTGIVEFWDSKNELLKINTIDDFNLNELITGKSTGYSGIISDKFKFQSFYNINSSSVVIRSWQDTIGFLNEDLQRIHNSEYYQYFSYSLKSIVPYNTWENAVGSLNHTSGFKKFSDLDVEIKNPTYISEDNIENPYVGIETNQNQGNVTSLANINSFAKINCKFDYDLVSENSEEINSKLISDQIYFESKEIKDYYNCIGNRVLSVDDISDQFRNRERLNVVNRFTL